MTAPLSAAESFLALLDDLAGTKPNGATAAVLLQHAGAHIRDLLTEVAALQATVEALDQCVCGEIGSRHCPAHNDVPRPGLSGQLETAQPEPAGPGHTPDLSHLPVMADDDAGQKACLADSPRDTRTGAYWTCTAPLGHPERWHVQHTPLGTPYAAVHQDAAWPVADRETDLPKWAEFATTGNGTPALACGAETGREPGKAALASYWVCNAVAGHAPLDHVAFGKWGTPLAGAVLARWASADSGTRPEDSENIISRFRTAQDVRRSGVLGPPVPVCTACRTQNGPVIDGLCADCAIDAADETRFRLTAVDGGDTG